MNFSNLPKIIIRNAVIVNEDIQEIADVLIENGRIEKIQPSITGVSHAENIDAEGGWLIPGMIDDQVHFRDPGALQKGTAKRHYKIRVDGGGDWWYHKLHVYAQYAACDTRFASITAKEVKCRNT